MITTIARILRRPLVVHARCCTQLAKLSTSHVSFQDKTKSNGRAIKSVISHEGDHGHTTTMAEVVRAKTHPMFDAIGAIEELSAAIGLAREFGHEANHEYVDKLKRLQTTLIDISSCISNYNEEKRDLPKLGKLFTKEVENWIEEYAADLPPVDRFLIPGGGRAATSLFFARTICRRAERHAVSLVSQGKLDKDVQVYFNRLGDFLFTCARMAIKYDKRTESVYVPRPPKPKNSTQKNQA